MYLYNSAQDSELIEKYIWTAGDKIQTGPPQHEDKTPGAGCSKGG